MQVIFILVHLKINKLKLIYLFSRQYSSFLKLKMVVVDFSNFSVEVNVSICSVKLNLRRKVGA